MTLDRLFSIINATHVNLYPFDQPNERPSKNHTRRALIGPCFGWLFMGCDGRESHNCMLPRCSPPPPSNQVFTTEGFLHLTMPESLMGSGIATPEVSTTRGGGDGDGYSSSPGSKRASSRSRRSDRDRDRDRRRRREDAAGEAIPTAFRDPDHPKEGLRPKVCVLRVC